MMSTRRTNWLKALSGCMGLLATPAWSAVHLQCDVTYAGATQTVRADPVQDPYGVPSVDVRGRFRFKAVVVGSPERVDRINLYVYQNTPSQPVLIQQARFLPPFAQALMGQQHLYAGHMERELIYSCQLLEARS